MDKNGSTLRLALKQRLKGTRKWPIEGKLTEKWRSNIKIQETYETLKMSQGAQKQYTATFVAIAHGEH